MNWITAIGCTLGSCAGLAAEIKVASVIYYRGEPPQALSARQTRGLCALFAGYVAGMLTLAQLDPDAFVLALAVVIYPLAGVAVALVAGGCACGCRQCWRMAPRDKPTPLTEYSALPA